MAALVLLVRLLHSLIQYPQTVGDGMDEGTRLLMELRAEFEELQRIRLLQEVEELELVTLEQSDGSGGATIWAAWQQWPLWVVSAVLALLLVLCLILQKRCCEPESSGQEKKSDHNEDLSANCKENHPLANKDVEITLAPVEKDNSAGVSGKGGSNAGSTGQDSAGSDGIEGSEDGKAGRGKDDVNADEDKKDDGNEEQGSSAVPDERDNDESEAKGGNEEAKAGEGSDDVSVEEDSKEARNEAEGSNAGSNENDTVGNEEEEGNDGGDPEKVNDDESVVKENSEAGNEEEGSSVDTNEDNKEARQADKKCNNATNEGEVNAKSDVQNDAAGNTGEKSDTNEDKKRDFTSKLGKLVQEHLQWPLVDLDRGCALVTCLMDNFIRAFGRGSSNHSLPVLQQAIGVGSAFEGWRPRTEGALFQVLVPLSAPAGLAFHLEADTGAKMPGRNFRVRVELECTCAREQLGDNAMPCLLHHSKEELSRKQEPSLLDTLCTGAYLDVEKTACWLYQLARADWMLLPQSSHCGLHLTLLPSGRSCKMQLSKGKESLVLEVLFGVQQGHSHVYVSSQPMEVPLVPSTTWHETYAVAEASFFRHVARRAPQDSWHCKCLQFLTCTATGTAFSTYALKTLFMHLLNTTPLTQWSRRDFLRRLVDIVDGLRSSLDKKRLDHFVIGNQRLPREIRLPPELQRIEPPNLFQRLAHDPGTYRELVQEYIRLQHQLKQLLLAAVQASAQ